MCNAGYYNHESNGRCVLCPGNTIKKIPGNAKDCSTDQSCNGITRVPNEGHTTCGKALLLLLGVETFCNFFPKYFAKT